MLPGQRGWAGQGFDEQDIRGKIGQHWDAWDQSGGVWQERKFITLTDHPHAESAAMLFIWEFFFSFVANVQIFYNVCCIYNFYLNN